MLASPKAEEVIELKSQREDQNFYWRSEIRYRCFSMRLQASLQSLLLTIDFELAVSRHEMRIKIGL